MNLKEWAKAQGLHPQTAYPRFREGNLPVLAERVGPRTILVHVDANTAPEMFCARLYGRHSAQDRAQRALKVAAGDG
ncbi:hypothetical protein ACWDYJ_30705 [Streptomyces sp. NPDC003042]